MKILITGATGFIGRRLVLRLRRDGHEVIAWVRDPKRARELLGAEPRIIGTDAGRAGLDRAVEGVDAIINLAGSPVARRWTASARAEIRSSRVDLTRMLVAAVAAAKRKPQVMISASAVGIYGDRGPEVLDERSPDGPPGFLRDVCREWEEAARGVEAHGVRLLLLRLGVVLGPEGGALATMRLPFGLGLGAVVGSGAQFQSFVHVDDVVAMCVRGLTDAHWRGVFNATAPEPVTNRQLSHGLARALHRPLLLRAPAFMVRAGFGGAAEVMLASQRAIPRAALSAGFSFAHPTLGDALEASFAGEQRLSIQRATSVPDVPYLRRRPPRYLLQSSAIVDAPVDEVLEFFKRAENLGTMTPPDLAFSILSPLPIPMAEGAEIRYRIGLGPVSMGWKTIIERWEPPWCFADAQYEGPYASWYHEHLFQRDGRRTKMIDRVWYAPPLGPLGALAQHLFIAAQLRKIFDFRAQAMALRFGVVQDLSEAA